MPVRNALAWLEEAVDSVLGDRSAPPFELVAVDDGSTDGSREWLAAAARRDPRVRLVPAGRVGLVAALNRALAEARAPLVARLDADDRSLPGRLAALVAYLEERPDVVLAGTGVELHPDGLAGVGMRRYVEWLNERTEMDLPREIWVESPLAHPTIGARRDALLAAGGYREGPFAEDYELLLRLHVAGARLGKIGRVLYRWRDHGARATRTDPRYAPEGFRTLKVDHLRRGPLRGVARVAVWGAGKTGRPFAAALRTAGFAVAAWIDVDPRLVGRHLHGAPILPVERVDALRGVPILVAVGARGARPLIRAELARRGFEELRDYVVCA